MAHSLARSRMDVAAVRSSAVEFGWPGGPPILRLPELSIARGERVFVRGPSGSGKSTLLSLLSGVLVPTSGRIEILGQDLGALGAAGRDRFRGDHIGYVFQMFNLLPWLSVIENVTLPARFSRRRRERAGPDARAEARRLLAGLGLGDASLERRRVSQLSIGQQQRVAAARALFGRPEILIADEPTSALDEESRAAFLDLLRSEGEAQSATLIFASHETSLANRFDRVIGLPA